MIIKNLEIQIKNIYFCYEDCYINLNYLFFIGVNLVEFLFQVKGFLKNYLFKIKLKCKYIGI